MDQDQPLALLNLTQDQQHLLSKLHLDLTYLLADFKFNDPKNQELLMLQHAALSGKRDQLWALLTHDETALAQAQEQLQERLNNPSSQSTE